MSRSVKFFPEIEIDRVFYVCFFLVLYVFFLVFFLLSTDSCIFHCLSALKMLQCFLLGIKMFMKSK